MRFLRSVEVGNWRFGRPGLGILRFSHGVLQPPRSYLVSRIQLFSVGNRNNSAQGEKPGPPIFPRPARSYHGTEGNVRAIGGMRVREGNGALCAGWEQRNSARDWPPNLSVGSDLEPR